MPGSVSSSSTEARYPELIIACAARISARYALTQGPTAD
jgi:hypothetical protein